MGASARFGGGVESTLKNGTSPWTGHRNGTTLRAMRTWGFSLVVACAGVAAACGQTASPITNQPSDAEIKQLMVRASIAAYDGTCPCPESRTGNGRLCGDSSAYRREGGKGLLCSAIDVSDEMVRRYRDLLAKE
jgi:hypothetical protein